MATGEPAAKKQKLEEIGANMNEDVKKALVDIDQVQTKIDEINEQASEEILKIEQKYNSERKPHYDSRSKLISVIPQFWATTFLNHPQLAACVAENEVELLKTITAFEVEDYDDIKRGFKIRFNFAPNDYFDNEKIEKDILLGDAPSTTTTNIKWKEGKSLARSEESESLEPLTFFEWLAENVDPTADDIAEVLKDDIWPNPVQYFLCPDIDEAGDEYEELLDEDEGLEEVDDDHSGNGEN